MSDDLQYGIRLTASGGDQVGAEFESARQGAVKVTVEAAKLNEAQKNLAASSVAAQQAWMDSYASSIKTAEAWKSQQHAITGASDEIQKILARYDPLGAKLRQLQTDFANLDKAIASGATGGTADSSLDKVMKAMNDEIGKTKGLMEQAGIADGFEKAAASGTHLGLGSAYARRELIILGREAVEGNFARMPGSMLTLAAHTGLFSSSMIAVAGPVAAAVAVVGSFIAAAVAGAKETEAMNNALAMTSGYAGLTRGTMRDLAQSVSDAGTLTIGTSKQIVTQLVASGQIGAQSIGAVAKLAGDYAAATGKDVSKIAPELIKMFEDPAKAAETLNKSMHSMSPAFLEHIAHLERIGQLDEAQLSLVQKMAEKVPKLKDNLGWLATAWDNVKKAASEAWNSMQGVGRTQTIEEQLAAAQANLANLQGRRGVRPGVVSAAQGSVADLQQQADDAALGASMLAEGARTNAIQQQSSALVNQTSEYHKIVELRDKITLANRLDADTDAQRADKARTIFNLNRQIEGVQRSGGAESKAFLDERIAQELKLFDIQNKDSQGQTASLLKLGQISQEEANRRTLSAQLDLNDAQQLATQQQMTAKNLLPIEKQKLADKLAQQVAEGDSLLLAAGYTQEITAHNRLLKENAEVLARDIPYLKALSAEQDKQNEALRQFHSSASAVVEQSQFQLTLVGKTKGQHEELTALHKLDLDYKIAYSALMDADGKIDQQKLDTLNKLLAIDKERVTTAGQQLGAATDALAVQKKNTEEWNKLWTSIESVGKQAFVHIFVDGKNAFDSIGKALKTAVIDLLYELTAKQWIIKIGASITGAGVSGVAGAAGGSGGGGLMGSLTGGGGGIGSLAGMLTGGADSLFQSAGVSMGSQWIADIGNNGFGLPFISGLAMAATGNVAGGIGSTLGGIAGSYFGPIGTAVGSALGGYVGGLFGGGKTSSVLQGFHTAGTLDAAGFHGNVTAGDQLGNQWAATGEAANLNNLSLATLLTGNSNPTGSQKTYYANLIGNKSLAIDFNSGADNTTIQGQLAALAKSFTDSLTPAANTAAASLTGLSTQQDKFTGQLQTLAAGLPSKLGIDTLQQFSDSLSTSAFVAPTDRLANGKSILADTYSRALSGDLNAVNAFPGAAQSVLSIGRDTLASGPQFADLFKEVNSELNIVLKQQQNTQLDILKDVDVSIQQAAQDQIGELRKQTAALVAELKNVKAAIQGAAA